MSAFASCVRAGVPAPSHDKKERGGESAYLEEEVDADVVIIHLPFVNEYVELAELKPMIRGEHEIRIVHQAFCVYEVALMVTPDLLNES